MNDVAILSEKRRVRVDRRGSVFTAPTPVGLRGLVTKPGMCGV